MTSSKGQSEEPLSDATPVAAVPQPFELSLAPGISLINDAFLRSVNMDRLPIGILLFRPDGAGLLANQTARHWLNLPESFVPPWDAFWSHTRVADPTSSEGDLVLVLGPKEEHPFLYRRDRVFNLLGEHVAEAVYLTPLPTAPAEEPDLAPTEPPDDSPPDVTGAGRVLGVLVFRESLLVASSGYDPRWSDVSVLEGRTMDEVARHLQRETEYGYFPRHGLHPSGTRGSWTFALVLEEQATETPAWDARNLMAATAHEMRSPLATIRGFLQLLPQAGPDDQKRYITIALREIDRISEIVNEFLEQHADAALGHQPLVDLRAPVHEAVLSLRALSEECGVALIEDAPDTGEASPDASADDTASRPQASAPIPVEPQDAASDRVPWADSVDPIWVRAQPNRLFQLARNLAENAIKAVPSPGGHVWISLTFEAPEFVRLTVDDDGPGIPPELRERVFEPAYTKTPGGHGFGLTIARWIAASAGGDLRVSQSAHGGARCEVRLPLATAPARRPGDVSAAPDPGPSPQSAVS